MTRILLISDIHGNYEALKAVLNDAHHLRFDEVVVLGDLVDYGPDPDLVIDEVRSLKPKAIVRGNHDHAVGYGVDCGCGPATHAASVYTREEISLKKLSSNDVKWLASLPTKTTLKALGFKGVLAVHATPAEELHDYLYPWFSDDRVTSSLKDFEGPALLVGHTHYQFTVRRLGKYLIANPGSVGQPRDGDPRAAYAIIDDNETAITFRRVKYDAETTIGKLEALVKDKSSLRLLKYLLMHGTLPR